MKNRKTGLLQSTCRACKSTYNTEWHAKNRVRHTAQIKAGKARLLAGHRELIDGLKRGNPCADCGLVFHPCAMDFDHVRGQKIDHVSKLSASAISRKRILDELAKCELVCANCHRVRTYNRMREERVSAQQR